MVLFWLYFPSHWNLVILSKEKSFFFYTFSSLYFFSYTLSKDIFYKFSFFKGIYSFMIKTFFTHFAFQFFFKLIKLILFSFSLIFFKKIKFKGKGYYIYKSKRNCIAPQFGLSHRKYFFFSSAAYLKLAKFSFLLYSKNLFLLSWVPFAFYYIRPINIFTQKGVRFYKQVTFSKEGYISGFR